MDKPKKAFLFNLEWHEVLKGYPGEVRLEVYDAIMRYCESGTLLEMKPLAKMAFSFIKKEIDYNEGKYQQIIDARRDAGRKSAEARKQQKATNPTSVDFVEQIQQKATNPTDNDNVNDKDIEKEKVEKEKATPTLPTSLPFDKLFGEISSELLGHGGDIWREEMTKAHGVTDFKVAFDQYRSYIIQNALENSIQSQGDFKRYFNWRAKEFLKDSAKKPKVEYFARIERLSDTKWVVHQYGGIDPIPVGTPDPPGPRYAWNGVAWEHI